MNRLRNHLHALLIVPLVVIAVTWPVFPSIFNGEEFWLINHHPDHWLRLWHAWHLERALAGQTELYYTDAMFHPLGTSLAFNGNSTLTEFLLLLLRKITPADSAFNLTLLLVLCFNAFCAYVLLLHLFDDKWIALFGALVFSHSVPFTSGSITFDLTMVGTLPLAVYFFRRSLLEKRWQLMALAGLCAGLTVFIGVYLFVFLLMSIGIVASFAAFSHWRQGAFWRYCFVFLAICCAIGFLRFYPLLIDAATLEEGLHIFSARNSSNDLLDPFIPDRSQFSGAVFFSIFDLAPDVNRADAYFGYINLFFIAGALFCKPLRRRIRPWLAIFACFTILGLGSYLTINGREYQDIALPLRALIEWLPALFGQVHNIRYYQIGVSLPLAVLACFGLWRLLQAKPAKARVLIALASSLIVTMEFYAPLNGKVLAPGATAYIDWLRSETEEADALINLPRSSFDNFSYYLYLQTITGHKLAFGSLFRNQASARGYIRNNMLLHSWDKNRSVHCLPYNERAYLSALAQLLADGITHVVVHHWRYGTRYIIHSFRGVSPAYDDAYVTVYRLGDLRQSCERLPIAPPQFSHFAPSPAAIPGARSSILSFHPNASLDDESLAYLDSLFSDWRSLIHLYQADGEWTIQKAGEPFSDVDAFSSENQVITVIYNSRETDRALLDDFAPLDGFERCQTESYEDGSVIETYIRQDYTCEILAPSRRLRVDYENGLTLANMLVEIDEATLDAQLMWSGLPEESHSISLQVFDAAGDKVLSQDDTIGFNSLARQRIDISSLAPGGYTVKLIVYNFHTGQSASGILRETGVRFERALEIATIART